MAICESRTRMWYFFFFHCIFFFAFVYWRTRFFARQGSPWTSGKARLRGGVICRRDDDDDASYMDSNIAREEAEEKKKKKQTNHLRRRRDEKKKKTRTNVATAVFGGEGGVRPALPPYLAVSTGLCVPSKEPVRPRCK